MPESVKDADVRDIVDALNSLSSDDRDEWVACGMAVKNALGDAGWSIWDAWSRKSKKYIQKDAVSVWKSVKPSGGVTVASLFYKAREAGWKPNNDRSFEQVIEDMKKLEPSAEEVRAYQNQTTQEHIAAAKRAQGILDIARRPEPGEVHPYLERKSLEKWRHYLVVDACDVQFPIRRDGRIIGHTAKTFINQLVIPMRNYRTNELQSVQLISEDGKKIFLPGSKVVGAAYRLGTRGAEMWLTEGFATGLSIRLALDQIGHTDDAIYVCFSAKNLADIGQKTRKNNLRQYVIADNDSDGTGYKKAQETGMQFWMPPEIGDDANDFHAKYGLNILKQQIVKLRMQDG